MSKFFSSQSHTYLCVFVAWLFLILNYSFMSKMKSWKDEWWKYVARWCSVLMELSLLVSSAIFKNSYFRKFPIELV